MPPHRIRGVKYNAETNDNVIEADSGVWPHRVVHLPGRGQ